ncbi:MAG: PRC-barrel domain containing protein [Desulfobacteraceae bacterium]|nr:MAG: PRC-barrel domain containing protein [Desulfobacteraceae bacterium]
MKKILLLACVFTMIFAFAATQSMAAGDQQKGTQTGSQYEKQDEKAGAAGKSTVDKSGKLGSQGAAQVSRISELMDKKVKNQQGQDLGQIEDLVVAKDGRISYIILSQGGVLGIGDKLTPIPFKNAQFDEQQDAVILSNIDKQKLENAPTISQGDWERLSDPGFERELFSYYGQQSGRETMQPGMSSGAAGSQQQSGSSRMNEPGSSGIQQPRSGGMQSDQNTMQPRSGQTGK